MKLLKTYSTDHQNHAARDQNRTPETPSRKDKPPKEIEFKEFGLPTVRFGTQKEIILPLIRDESRIKKPLRAEQHENEQQRTQTRAKDEDRMSSSLSRNNQSRNGLRENPTPKTYQDFLIHEITTARNALRTTKQVNLTI